MATRASTPKDGGTEAITFVIPGKLQPASATRGQVAGTSKGAVQVGMRRDGGSMVRLTAQPGEDIVAFTLAHGPTLVLHPEHARDLLRAQATGPASRGLEAGAMADEVAVPAQLGWPGQEADATRGATRGSPGNVILSAFEVVTGLIRDPAVDLATAAVTRALDGAVDQGIYQLAPEPMPKTYKGSGAKLSSVKAAADDGLFLVLIHGTFVDTVSSFGKLWSMYPAEVRKLFQKYDNRVYALDHPTLGESPFANALALVKAMPAGARLHLLTHSRGGLVAEVLARACGRPLDAEQLAFFADPKHAGYRSELQVLSKMAQAKRLRVERVVRVACPARGTLLASRRLDAYLSVLQWGLQLASVPVAPQLVDFLQEVARRRADPAELPGLEAMMPESPVVAWLNGSEESIPGELRVVAGDIQGDSVVSWIKTLLADGFYWTDNDLIVQTRSMYGGTPRVSGIDGPAASFYLDRGAKVSHFSYFANSRTAAAVVQALIEAKPTDFATIGPLSWAGQDASGTRGLAAAARSRGVDATGASAAERPAVFVLPGILGSNLKLDGKRIWLSHRIVNGLKKLAWDPSGVTTVEPDGPIGSTYDRLIERLAETHEVIPFAYDWRRPIEDEARRLAIDVDAALAAREASNQPVRLLAHSMGGLVARTMQLEAPETWSRLMARDGARLLMLGTPNGGSWAPMQTLSGDDTFGNALVSIGSLFDNGGARRMMAGLPGFIQLQAALLDPQLGLDQASTWQKLADDDMAALRARSGWHDEGAQRAIYEWGAPPQAVLDQAVALRRRLDAQVALLSTDASKILLVIGHASFTPAGIVLGNDGLVYLDAPDEGDGRVTLESALLPGVRTWRVDASHGSLPNETSAFFGYVELLRSGQTKQLDAFTPPARTRDGAPAPAAAMVRSRPAHGAQPTQPPSSRRDVFQAADTGRAATAAPRATGSALRVKVLNGDLQFVHQPLIVGHYRSLALTGTEKVVDRLVAQSMSRSLAIGLYPEVTGSNQIFDNKRPDPRNLLAMARPTAAVVVGLGDEGKLDANSLVYTVRRAVLAYAQRVNESQDGGASEFEMAATLIGSGGTGISAGVSARLIAQGAYEANQKLREGGWPQMSRLVLVELYLDRASEAWRSLQVQAHSNPNQLELVGTVDSGPGGLRRALDPSYRGAAYDFISALSDGEEGANASIAFTLDTKRARTEVRAQRTQSALLRDLVEKASDNLNTDALIGRTLFNLLVPVEVEPYLSGTGEMLIELDHGTASIPWELLDVAAGHAQEDPRPWAVRAKLLRKLRTETFRSNVIDATTEDNVLVIGDPLCPPLYESLAGARSEAVAVVERLTQVGSGIAADKVRALVDSNDARSVINALYERHYRAVHVAGHGAPGASGGVVLSGDNTFLGVNEIEAMRTVPELVFLNCCHLAARDSATTLARYNRAAFAANIAEALIRIGVRCVIAAGWAVEDTAAELFAQTFYATLLQGARFIDAVGAARQATWELDRHGNTWAAYQCYGDPEWTWRREGQDAQRPDPPLDDVYSGINSVPSLTVALETLAISSVYGGAPNETQLDQLRYLEDKFGAQWGAAGTVAESFGVAYAAAGGIDKAIEWYRAALEAADGSATFRAAEQLGNALARQGGKLADPVAARKAIKEAIDGLERLVTLKSTAERQNLLGSAYKRLTMVETTAGRKAAAQTALEATIKHYGLAETLAREAGSRDLFYPAKNCISAQLRSAFLKKQVPQIDVDRIRIVSDSLQGAAAEAPDFWSVVGQIELQILSALSERRLAAALPGLSASLSDLKGRVPGQWMWDSVHNEAQFTLVPYLTVARAGEARAAKALIELLRGLATR